MSATGVPIGWPMVALHLWNERGIVMFSRDDEGRDLLKIVAAQDEPLAKDIVDAWWAATPRPFLLPQESEETVLIALGSANDPLSASAIRLQKLLAARS